MALALGVYPGSVIYFGDIPVKVLSFDGHSQAVLLIEDKEYTVTDTKATEVMKGVYVSCGVPKVAREGGVILPRLLIEAPRSLTILREELYGKPRPEKQQRVFSSP